MLERDLDEIDANGNFIPWEEVKKDMGSEPGSIVRIFIEERVKEFIRELPEKDRRVIGEHIERLSDHRMQRQYYEINTRKPRWRMHISMKYTLFYHVDSDFVWIDKIMTIEQAHKKYGKI